MKVERNKSIAEAKRITKETITRTIDHQTGEVLDTALSQSFVVDREPNYVKLYVDDILKLSNLPRSSNSLIYELLKRVAYNNEVIIIKAIRNEICKSLGIGDSTFRKGIDEFISKGILTKKDKQIFVFNPFLFGRGAWQDIKKIRLLVEYSEKGRFLIRQEEEQTTIEFPNEVRPAISGIRFTDDKFGTEEEPINKKGNKIFICY